MKLRSFITAITLLSLSSALFSSTARAQAPYDDLYFYRITFKDKGENPEAYSPDRLLSPAAIARREKYDIPYPDITDIPVSRQYISEVTRRGFICKSTSKWMNTALFSSTVSVDTEELQQLPFITRVQLVKRPPKPPDPPKRASDKFGVTEPMASADAYDPKVPLNATILHKSGLTGQRVTIAILDAGFDNADIIESLEPLHQRGGIIATHDFVTGLDHVYDYHTHGTSVLSILAGTLRGILSGTAPGADYILLRTEDDKTEYPIEEDYWAAAAEYADSTGADIITSSLGYSTFDDPEMNYSFSDMDGNSTFITRAADIAASKGILVVNSAGNERNKEWIRITAPSDGDSVLCVGAVKHDLTISDFSSAGYSYDRQVKPDVVAPGVSLPIQFERGSWHIGSGTSFSCPVISGLAASLMQAVPEASPAEIITVLHKSSDRYSRPDSLYGYGLPDFLKALMMLEEIHTLMPETIMTAGPNPFFDEINLWFRDPPGSLTVTITGINGNRIRQWHYPLFAARSLRLYGLDNLGQGVYILKVVTDQGERVFKMIKMVR